MGSHKELYTPLLFAFYDVCDCIVFECTVASVWSDCVSRQKLKKVVGAACIGGGQGIAVLLEAV